LEVRRGRRRVGGIVVGIWDFRLGGSKWWAGSTGILLGGGRRRGGGRRTGGAEEEELWVWALLGGSGFEPLSTYGPDRAEERDRVMRLPKPHKGPPRTFPKKKGSPQLTTTKRLFFLTDEKSNP
jgi:hypothetical protein